MIFDDRAEYGPAKYVIIRGHRPMRTGLIRHVGRLVVTGACVALCGCSVRPGDIGRAPEMSAVGSGIAPKAVPMALEPKLVSVPLTRTSTWRDESADLFTDPRARRVGDVVTVKIQIKDKASFDNSTNRQRDSTQSVGGKLNWKTEPNAVDLSATADAAFNGGTKTEGKGAITRSEHIDLLLAAVVTDVLPNGNLFISGSQEVRVNFEVRELAVAGVVRPRDISTDNTVSYDKIAEARISYGGRGRITEVQQPGVVHQIFDIITPF